MNYIISIFKDLAEITPTTLSILIAIIAVIVILAIIGPKAHFNTKSVVYGGLCIAVSFVLSYIRFFRWPQGGSITLASMLPMFVYAYIFGPLAGIIAGSAYGLLQLIQDPFIVHPIQVLLDYIIAFGALGLAGYSRHNLSLGVLLGGFGRFLASFLSGILFFASYAPEGMNPALYSIAVNGLVIGTDALICFIISLIPQVRNTVERLRSNVLKQ